MHHRVVVSQSMHHKYVGRVDVGYPMRCPASLLNFASFHNPFFCRKIRGAFKVQLHRFGSKIDFSDTIELLWILEQIDFVDDNDSSKQPWNNFADIYNRFEPVDGSAAYPVCYICGCPSCQVGNPSASFAVPSQYLQRFSQRLSLYFIFQTLSKRCP